MATRGERRTAAACIATLLCAPAFAAERLDAIHDASVVVRYGDGAVYTVALESRTDPASGEQLGWGLRGHATYGLGAPTNVFVDLGTDGLLDHVPPAPEADQALLPISFQSMNDSAPTLIHHHNTAFTFETLFSCPGIAEDVEIRSTVILPDGFVAGLIEHGLFDQAPQTEQHARVAAAVSNILAAVHHVHRTHRSTPTRCQSIGAEAWVHCVDSIELEWERISEDRGLYRIQVSMIPAAECCASNAALATHDN